MNHVTICSGREVFGGGGSDGGGSPFVGPTRPVDACMHAGVQMKSKKEEEEKETLVLTFQSEDVRV